MRYLHQLGPGHFTIQRSPGKFALESYPVRHIDIASMDEEYKMYLNKFTENECLPNL